MAFKGLYIGIAIAIIVIVVGISIYYTQILITKKPTITTGNVTTYPILKLSWISPELIPKSWLIEHGIYDKAWSWWTFVRGQIVTSPNGKFIAVTTQKGEVYIFDSDGRIVRKLTFALGEVPCRVVFSPNGKYLVIGVASREGKLLVYDVNTWKLIFEYKVSNDLLGLSNASEATIIKRPSYGNRIPYIVFDKRDRMYISINQFVIDPKTQRLVHKKVSIDLFEIYPELRKKYPNLTKYIISRWTSIAISKVIAIDMKTWKILWKWPKDDYAYISIPILDVDNNGKYLVLGTWLGYYFKDPKRWHGGTVFVINASNGELLYRWDIPPRIPVFNYTSIYNGIDLTSDGKYLIILTSDGRIFLVDNERSVKLRKPVLLWNRTFTNPIIANILLIPKKKGGEFTVKSTYVYSYSGLAGIIKDRIIVYTSATYAAYWSPRYVRKPLIQHPNQTKLFIFDLRTGKLLYIDKFFGIPRYGKPRPFAFSGCYLAAPIGSDWVSSDASMAGVYVWDVCKLRQIARFHTVPEYGVPADVAISGNRIYVLTGPINIAHSPREPAKIVGEYRLVALEIVK